MEILRGYGLGYNLKRLLHRFGYDQAVVTKTGRFYGRTYSTERGVTQGSPGLYNILQHCGGRSGKGGTAGSLRVAGSASWVGMDSGRELHSVIYG